MKDSATTMRRPLAFLVLAAAAMTVSTAALPGCSGGTFHLDGPLARTPALSVSGELGLNAVACGGADAGPPRGLAAGDAVTVGLGSLSGTLSPPHRGIHANERLFGEGLLRDYEAFLTKKSDSRAALVGEALVALGEAGTRESVSADASVVAKMEQTLAGIHALLALPSEVTQTTSFNFFALRHGHTIAMACASSETARTMAVLDGPRFTMTCRMVSSADGVPRDLNLRAYGSWANYKFSGALRGAAAGEAATFDSQSVVVMGAGGVRGFELRVPGGGQLAAISFWQVRVSQDESEPRAWLLPQRSPGWEDAMAATLAMAYVFPWPTHCDDRALAGGTSQASP